MIRQRASDSSIGNVSLIDVTISLRIAIAHQLVLTKVGILQKVVIFVTHIVFSENVFF